jgi:NAD(P)-dependent dehydrogenase (short-subunit alcohol dehydrogenase family)
MPLPKHPRAVVTGAASGLGRAFALQLASRRARLLVADVDDHGLEETVRLVAQAGGEVHAARCDVSKSDEVGALLGAADRTLGGVDLLVNNAGVSVSGSVGEVPLDDWEWILGVNLWGVIYGCHHFVPRFKQQRSGHIVNVASAGGLFSLPNLAPYNVTKAGVVALSEGLSVELAEHGVGVTVLCPMSFKTRLFESGRSHKNSVSADLVAKLMGRAKIQADGVARFALEAADAGRLYAVPHTDGRWFWRLKRTVPELLQQKLLPRAHLYMQR